MRSRDVYRTYRGARFGLLQSSIQSRPHSPTLRECATCITDYIADRVRILASC